jgi:magnesium chelatase subunit H
MTIKASKSIIQPSVRVLLLTMDTHLNSTVKRTIETLKKVAPFISLKIYSATEYTNDDRILEKCRNDIAQADIIFVGMLFLENQFLPIMDDLKARRDHCDALVCAVSAAEVVKLTKIGKFDMSKPASGPMAFIKKLKGDTSKKNASSGERQMKMLRRVPKLLRFIPGTAQDLRAYFLCLQYWLGGSEDNMLNLALYLVSRYGVGNQAQNRELFSKLTFEPPFEYPDVGVYHPRMKPRIAAKLSSLPNVVNAQNKRGQVGVLMLRSYLLANNTEHYDAVIAALEVQGLKVIPAFAAGLDARSAINEFFIKDGMPVVDAVVSLTGFSLVGGPAYNDAHAAEEILSTLDVPYIAAHPVEFQTLDQWGQSQRGLLPVESTIMIAIPELDGAVLPMVFGGRPGAEGVTCQGCHMGCTFTKSQVEQDMFTCTERTAMLSQRVAKLVDLRKTKREDKKVSIVLFNFPPNAGNIGTAAYLAVFESVFETMLKLKSEGYHIDMPASVDQLREDILNGNSKKYGADANVQALIPTQEHIRRETHLREIEAQWGPAPGKQLNNGANIFVLGKQYGNVLIAIQPSFGYEGDPMRLLFEKGFAPTHAFSAFYRYLREDFKSTALLHFGTHGALEFMPGKQNGLTAQCWPDRLILDMPNFYLYAANNPSEGAIAKRRSGATLLSYLTPPMTESGLYTGLLDLKSSLERYRALDLEPTIEKKELALMIQAQAADIDLCAANPLWIETEEQSPTVEQFLSTDQHIQALMTQILELEYSLIPNGLHVLGKIPSESDKTEFLKIMAEASFEKPLPQDAIQAISEHQSSSKVLGLAQLPNDENTRAKVDKLLESSLLLNQNSELDAIVRALDAKYIRPAPGGDIIHKPEILPTGRNLHGFDPFRIPSPFAMKDGAIQAEKILTRYCEDGEPMPESIAMVLWGSDNLKTEGAQIAQVLRMYGAKPRFDSFGRLVGAALISLEELGRPRIDVVISLSGIFRDLMPLQIKLLAEAAYLAANADEPVEQNFVKKHALQYMKEHQCDLQTAALRVFGNADSAYGANVNNLIESGAWSDENELGETYSQRKGFAFGMDGSAVKNTGILKSALADVQLTYQNLDSVELGVTTIDNYFDTLGGITKAVQQANGGILKPVFIGDQTKGEGRVRSLSDQVALETRTRILNPKWYEGMLKHGFEGVRQIEVHLTNTMGWSATTGQVQPWVYKQITETFVLNTELRQRLAELNPTASMRLANRLLEASQRKYWTPDDETLEKLKLATEELEDRLEGVY